MENASIAVQTMMGAPTISGSPRGVSDRHARAMAGHYGLSPARLWEEQVRAWLVHKYFRLTAISFNLLYVI